MYCNRKSKKVQCSGLIHISYFSPLSFSFSYPPIRRGQERMKETEVKAGKSREHELGKWSVLSPSNVSPKPCQLQTWKMCVRCGEVDPQVDRLYDTL